MADQEYIDDLERRLAMAEARVAELQRQAAHAPRGFLDDAEVSPFRSHGLSGTSASPTSPEQSRAALQRSEERLDLALEATNLAVYEWDLISDHLIVNARFKELVGIPPNEAVIGSAVLRDCVHPDDLVRIDPDLKRAMDGASDGKFAFEHRVNRFGPDGETWVLSHGQVFFTGPQGDRRPGRVFGTLQDITERKRSEIALSESEKRQAFLLRFSDSLRAEPEANAVANRALQMLLDHMELDRCYITYYHPDEDYAEFPYQLGNESVPPLPPTVRLSDFPDAYEQVLERTFVINDDFERRGLSEEERVNSKELGMRAMLASTIRRGEKNPLSSMAAVSSRPRHWTAAEIALVEETAERTWAAIERVQADTALRESEERFRQFANASSAGLWIRNAETLQMEFVSPAVGAIYGAEAEALLGDVKQWASLIVPEDRESALRHLESARGGETALHEFRIQRVSDGAFRWIRNTDFPLQRNGHVQRIGGIAEDVTEAKLAIEHQGVLLAELQHRVRNIMAMIRSMANRTAPGAEDKENYRSLLEGRLLALARVQALLTRGGNTGGSLRDILQEEIAAQAHHGGQYDLTGPEVMLSPKAVEVLTLAFHELATNALKYGALSVPEGKLAVSWASVEKKDLPWLALEWQETGGPQRGPSKRRGFGSELIEARVAYELRGSGKITLGPGGAHCRLEFPLSQAESILETDAPQPRTVFGGTLDMSDAPDLKGRRVLLVEDEYYMAADTAAALRGAGAEVIGPSPSEAATMEILDNETPTHAVLDLNLGGGGPRFEIARTLQERGVPFLFLTGYDPDVIPANLSGVVRLQKPVAFRAIVDAVSQL